MTTTDVKPGKESSDAASQAKKAPIGMPPRNPSNQHSGFNKFGLKGKGKGGPQVMRKHAARSR